MNYPLDESQTRRCFFIFFCFSPKKLYYVFTHTFSPRGAAVGSRGAAATFVSSPTPRADPSAPATPPHDAVREDRRRRHRHSSVFSQSVLARRTRSWAQCVRFSFSRRAAFTSFTSSILSSNIILSAVRDRVWVLIFFSLSLASSNTRI